MLLIDIKERPGERLFLADPLSFVLTARMRRALGLLALVLSMATGTALAVFGAGHLLAAEDGVQAKDPDPTNPAEALTPAPDGDQNGAVHRYLAARTQQQFLRAREHATAGRYALARSYLTPMTITPSVTDPVRAMAYYQRGRLFYADGMPVSAAQDYSRALEYAPEHVPTLADLGWLYLQGEGVAQSDELAAALLAKAADGGNVQAQFNMGMLHSTGRAVDADPARARTWLQLAAEAGHVGAMYSLANMQRQGEGGPVDLAAAERWYRQAADEGRADAMSRLGFMARAGQLQGSAGEPDQVAAAQWFQAAAELGYGPAQGALAWALATGTGITEDQAAAVHWYRQAAEQGSAHSMFSLAVHLRLGEGVAKDQVAAIDWMRKAAAAGSFNAQLALGQMYHQGIDVPADAAAAKHWLEQAAVSGDAAARNALAWLLATNQDASVRDGQRALDLARAAVADQPEPAYQDTLAAAHAEAGDYAAAAKVQQEALAALPPDTTLRGDFEQRLATYRNGQPWRE